MKPAAIRAALVAALKVDGAHVALDRETAEAILARVPHRPPPGPMTGHTVKVRAFLEAQPDSTAEQVTAGTGVRSYHCLRRLVLGGFAVARNDAGVHRYTLTEKRSRRLVPMTAAARAAQAYEAKKAHRERVREAKRAAGWIPRNERAAIARAERDARRAQAAAEKAALRAARQAATVPRIPQPKPRDVPVEVKRAKTFAGTITRPAVDPIAAPREARPCTEAFLRAKPHLVEVLPFGAPIRREALSAQDRRTILSVDRKRKVSA